MLFLLLKLTLLYIIGWIGWKYIRQHVFKGSLENIPGPPSKSFLKGNFGQLFGLNGWQFHIDISERYGSVLKVKGPLGKSIVYLSDPKAMHYILVKDQLIYVKPMAEGSRILLGDSLVTVVGEQHKKHRKMLNPAFSTAHMRQIVPIFWAVSTKLRDTLAARVRRGTKEDDMLHWMARMALELVGQSGLGYSFDPMTENSTEHPYSEALRQYVPLTARLVPLRGILIALSKIGSPKFRRWLVDITPSETIHKLRDITDLMHKTSVEILDSKRKALTEGDDVVSRQVAHGKDIMSILLKANVEASEDDQLSEAEVVAQVSTLMFAAVDTTSNALSRILHLLSIHQDVQEKLRRELNEAPSKEEELGYDELMSLPYLDAVCRETLRLYPPVSQIARVATKDAVLPLSNPVKGLDGRDMQEIFVPKGSMIFISILASNTNPEIWGEDSYEWKPERWLAPLPDSVKDAGIPGIYSNLMTFIGGGKACIGFKFSLLEMKAVLVTFLKAFKFAPADKQIVWTMNGIAIPTIVGGDITVPSLPLKISLA